MKKIRLLPGLLLSAALCFYSCEKDDNRTEILYQATINVLENQTIPYPVPDGDRITGFYLGTDLSDRPLHQSVTYDLPEVVLDAAGSEVGICNDGERYNFGFGSTLLNFLTVIGDTGGDDVSDNEDCDCDTRIDVIEFNALEVVFETSQSIQFSPSRLEGNTLMCPNIPDGHHINGDREFGGSVLVTASVTLRVSDDRQALLADIRYHAIEAD